MDRTPGAGKSDMSAVFHDLAERFKKRKISPGTVTQRLAALRFFYIKILKIKRWLGRTSNGLRFRPCPSYR